MLWFEVSSAAENTGVGKKMHTLMPNAVAFINNPKLNNDFAYIFCV
jgi:hypothetical protein